MRRSKRMRRGGENGSFWISYSDMMAGMLFTFALILFMAVYQLVDLQQKKTIELETKDIKDAGVFNGKVRLHVGVVASFKIQVEVEQA